MHNLLFAIMYPDKNILDRALAILKDRYGKPYARGPEYDFNFTDYYEEEFGKNLKKSIFVFEKEITKTDLTDIRQETAKVEKEISYLGRRRVNIDPGYISDKEMVLATKKQKQWKEYLGGGVYAHKIFEFLDDGIKTFNHSFADYKLKENMDFFRSVLRKKYK